eukprot:gene32929-55486_t
MTRIRFDGSWAHPPLSRSGATPRGEVQRIPLAPSSPVAKSKTKRLCLRIMELLMKVSIFGLAVAAATLSTVAIAAKVSPLGAAPPSGSGLPTGQCIRS